MSTMTRPFLDNVLTRMDGLERDLQVDTRGEGRKPLGLRTQLVPEVDRRGAGEGISRVWLGTPDPNQGQVCDITENGRIVASELSGLTAIP